MRASQLQAVRDTGKEAWEALDRYKAAVEALEPWNENEMTDTEKATVRMAANTIQSLSGVVYWGVQNWHQFGMALAHRLGVKDDDQ